MDFIGDPFYEPESKVTRYIPDGLLVVRDGMIQDFGHYQDVIHAYPDVPITDYGDRLLMPGFIDTHIHYPQIEMIAAYGEQLLSWLDQYTFPTEIKFQQKDYAQEIAEVFVQELLRNGTTTALVFAAVYPESAEALFEVAERYNLCLITGKVMMDRHAPAALCDTVQSAYEDTRRLIQTWHKRGRLRYAITPRYAATSTPEQLQIAGKLLQEFPDVYLHTHMSENVDEVAWIQELFPDSQDYLQVYEQAGLVTSQSIFAHGIHLSDSEFQRLAQAEAAIAFCPTSNLFLGSGLFRIEQAKSVETPVKVGLGTDIGAGTSFSLLQTANEAYKIAQLRRQKLSAYQALFLATLGGAKALNLDHELGNFDTGKAADFIALDLRPTPLLAFRNPATQAKTLDDLTDRIFALIMLGDDRAIAATHILGQRVYPA